MLRLALKQCMGMFRAYKTSIHPRAIVMQLRCHRGATGLTAWCQPDFNGDDVINAADLAQLLGDWGPCD